MTALPLAMPAAPSPHEVPPGAASTPRRRDPSQWAGDRGSGGSDFNRTFDRAMQRTRRDRSETPSRSSVGSDAPDQRVDRSSDPGTDTMTRATESTTADDELETSVDNDPGATSPPVTGEPAPVDASPTAADTTTAGDGSGDAVAADNAAEADGSAAVELAAAAITAAITAGSPAAAGSDDAADSAAGATGTAVAAAGAENATGASTTAAPAAGSIHPSSTATGATPTGAGGPGTATAAPATGARATVDPAAVPGTADAAAVDPDAATAVVAPAAATSDAAPSAPNVTAPPSITPSAVQSVVAPPPQAPAAPAPAAGTPAAVTAEAAPEPRGVELGDLGARLGASLRRNERTQTLTIQLHPAELGAITVEARLVDGVTHLHMAPESASTADRLASQLADLRHQLARAGVDVGDLDLGDRRDRTSQDATSNLSDHRSDNTTRRVARPSDSQTTDRQTTDRQPIHHRGGQVAIDL